MIAVVLMLSGRAGGRRVLSETGRSIGTMKTLRPVFAALCLAATVVLAGCQGGLDGLYAKESKPIPAHLKKKMEAKGMTAASPILVRIFKEENTAEVWKQTDTGRYALLEEYEICKWSGALGPKFQEGDRQAPEGFYTVNPWQMNPKSEYHLSFNLGFPNSFDRSHGRTGSHLMMHGACSSAGCYSMTDELIEEIFALAREAFEGGQRAFQVQAFPFRMTPENMARHKDNPHFEFWKMLKEGHDHFELTKVPPKVDVCGRRYVFNREIEEGEKFDPVEQCPQMSLPDELQLAYSEKAGEHEAMFQKALEQEALKARLRGGSLPPFDTLATLAPPPVEGPPAIAQAHAPPGTTALAKARTRASAPTSAQAFAPEQEAATTSQGAVPNEAVAVPVPQRSPLAAPAVAEKHKRRGLFGLFQGD